MKIVGKHYSIKADGGTTTTLHITTDFSDYYNDSSSGRHCEGLSVETIYVGNHDCSKLPIGSDIEISYEKAMQTKNGGIYQPIKEIRIVKNN